MVPRTVATAAPPISAPTSCTPDSTVTSVLFTRLSTPTATISLLVIAPWTARATTGLVGALPSIVVSSRRVALPSVRADGCRAAMDLSCGGARGDDARGPVSSKFVHEGGNAGGATHQQPFPHGQRSEPQRTAQRRQRHRRDLRGHAGGHDAEQRRARGGG